MAKEKFSCWVKPAFCPALTASFTDELASVDSQPSFTSKCPTPDLEYTSQNSKPRFLRLGTYQMPQCCTGNRLKELIENSAFSTDLGTRMHCAGQ